ncbi:Gfo/Idh/MocA family protein [Homoserinibacter gongjuensis]|uniref:Oxidoreductase n=1 Tax=Homoserinibacter gongjuensis TaxID=1162968 RepID=A0ABQ6K0J0_9MICO|nr:Gfo/Idh/MocA family oxidoreductase [Homoserinibacter gongjuensis]GMA92316.1 oxidoreductase [Homoserinibacter gongjuensis]
MTAPVRWGVGSVAGINAATVPAILASETAELAGLASRDPERARRAAEEWGGVGYAGYDALLSDTRVEAVYVPTPNAQHAEWVHRAIGAGKHVLCEKPLAVTAEEARALVAAAEDAGVLLSEAFMYLHHPRYTRLRELFTEGAIGELRGIHVVFTFDASDELEHSGFQGAPGSGAIYDVGCYAVHVARTLTGAEPEAVTAHAAVSEPHGGIDMSTALLLEFPGGVAATAQLGMWSADLDTVMVIGSRGRIEVPSAFLRGPDDHVLLLTDADGTRRIETPRADHYERQIARFDAAVRGEAELLLPPDDAVRQAEVLDAATLSWRERRRVELSAR